MQQAVIGELPRAAEVQSGDMIELGDACQNCVGHQSLCVHGGDATVSHYSNQFVPLFVAELPAWRDFVFFRIDRVCRDARGAGGDSLTQSCPTTEAHVLSDESLCFIKLEIIFRHSG